MKKTIQVVTKQEGDWIERGLKDDVSRGFTAIIGILYSLDNETQRKTLMGLVTSYCASRDELTQRENK